MEAISGDSSRSISQNEVSSIKSQQPSPIHAVEINQQLQASSLSDHSLTASRAKQSSTDIREDVIMKAKNLMADPNWLSDDNITQLSAKILEVEDFES
jgi:hypothetical protein